jgi:hypothetical protein
MSSGFNVVFVIVVIVVTTDDGHDDIAHASV